MSEHEQEQNEDQQDDESPEEFARELEADPSTAGGDDEPLDDLRGG